MDVWGLWGWICGAHGVGSMGPMGPNLWGPWGWMYGAHEVPVYGVRIRSMGPAARNVWGDGSFSLGWICGARRLGCVGPSGVRLWDL